MLEAEEVDDDFFTPVASTSLANIFGNMSKTKESTENNSLKYVPPKPQSVIPKKKEPVKATECVFACALIGHEWCNNVYTSRGKLGFAIIKIQKSGDHNIVLYDSNKTTLSSTAVSPQLEVTIKNNTYISYYDSLQKYWSIYGTDEEVKKIDDLLRSLGVNVNYSNCTDKDPLQPNKSEIKTNASLEESTQQNRESDTDSSVNRKTKASILNRMANMGHSVLPTRKLPVERTSDSSDTNEMETQPKGVRHKSTKPYMKKNNVENIVSEPQQLTEAHQRIIIANTEPDKNIAVFNHHSQLIPITNTGVIANPSNELNMFMTEQRISNSELRINLTRITDKVDSVLDKIKSLDHNEKPTNVSTDILLKLLTEYENKIKAYEELLKSKGLDDRKNTEDLPKLKNEKVEVLKNKLFEIESINADKSDKICNLQKEIKLLKELHSQDKQEQATREKEFTTKIDKLEDSLKEKSKELIDLIPNVDPGNDNIQNKVKNIMNDTFQTISMNFEDSDVYTGETIKRTVGTVIKKITINMLSEFKQN